MPRWSPSCRPCPTSASGRSPSHSTTSPTRAGTVPPTKPPTAHPSAATAGRAQVELLNRLNREFIATRGDMQPLQMVPTEYRTLDDSAYRCEIRETSTPGSDLVHGCESLSIDDRCSCHGWRCDHDEPSNDRLVSAGDCGPGRGTGTTVAGPPP
ncbi:beta-N-acetylglucosaminidase domain-containing protein [Micromonospora sp. NPDC052213]|uniref:beta-N-acetylglucosaminidase domain-containing protein n=1 Tax=Micromonospora sp. NPDC052213 TaxID=3155812 RepID=UPI003436B75A